MALTVTYIEKEQNWDDEATIYWFYVDGHCANTGVEFDFDTFGVVESSGQTKYIAHDMVPLTPGDNQTISVVDNCMVTDEMRNGNV